MKRRIKLYIALVLLSGSCVNPTPLQNEGINSSQILTISLAYILETVPLAPAYKNQPLQIVQSKKQPLQEAIMVNGRRCIILPDSTNVTEMMRGMNIFKPLPVVEFSAIKKIKGGMLELDLVFRTTGNWFLLWLKKNKLGKYEVIKLVQRTI